MVPLNTILVVDDSSVLRALARTILAPHAAVIDVAASLASARDAIAVLNDLSLVLCDVILPGGTGFELLDEFGNRDGREPAFIMLTSSPNVADAERARACGAIGYLAKPIRWSDIGQCLAKTSQAGAQRPERVTAPRLGSASVIDPGSGTPIFDCEVRDLSRVGAFLVTPGRIDVSTRLLLNLEFESQQTLVEADVVRVQEPAWGQCGGAGIAFLKPLDEPWFS